MFFGIPAVIVVYVPHSAHMVYASVFICGTYIFTHPVYIHVKYFAMIAYMYQTRAMCISYTNMSKTCKVDIKPGCFLCTCASMLDLYANRECECHRCQMLDM